MKEGTKKSEIVAPAAGEEGTSTCDPPSATTLKKRKQLWLTWQAHSVAATDEWWVVLGVLPRSTHENWVRWLDRPCCVPTRSLMVWSNWKHFTEPWTGKLGATPWVDVRSWERLVVDSFLWFHALFSTGQLLRDSHKLGRTGATTHGCVWCFLGEWIHYRKWEWKDTFIVSCQLSVVSTDKWEK